LLRSLSQKCELADHEIARPVRREIDRRDLQSDDSDSTVAISLRLARGVRPPTTGSECCSSTSPTATPDPDD
jgi:hypothetical protein